jgi:fructose-specific phosphotransferase system IIC component
MNKLSSVVQAIGTVIINPILALLFAGGLLVFIFGVAEFFFELDVRGDQHAKEAGKQHMLWGIIGMFIMFSAAAILQVIAATVNQFPN